jgi:hypothetical protein
MKDYDFIYSIPEDLHGVFLCKLNKICVLGEFFYAVDPDEIWCGLHKDIKYNFGEIIMDQPRKAQEILGGLDCHKSYVEVENNNGDNQKEKEAIINESADRKILEENCSPEELKSIEYVLKVCEKNSDFRELVI